MRKLFIRIIIWLGIMAFLTLVAMGSWWFISGGSQTTASLKWLQLAQTIATFALPPILCAWLWSYNHQPFAWLKLDKKVPWQTVLLCIAIMICAIPGINLLADLNGRIVFPECLRSLETVLRQQEDAAAALTERFLQADNAGVLLLNIGLMALLPAFAEELTFRGTLQQILPSSRIHLAIWLTAIIFSAIHMQFYGFVPRMLMGAMFGYIFAWTGSLWAPIIMHFTNNAIAVLSYYWFNQIDAIDTIGAKSTWWLGALSIVVVIVLLRQLHLRVH